MFMRINSCQQDKQTGNSKQILNESALQSAAHRAQVNRRGEDDFKGQQSCQTLSFNSAFDNINKLFPMGPFTPRACNQEDMEFTSSLRTHISKNSNRNSCQLSLQWAALDIRRLIVLLPCSSSWARKNGCSICALSRWIVGRCSLRRDVSSSENTCSHS